MPRKYDDTEVIERAKSAIREQGLQNLREVAMALDIPRTSLNDILYRQGISGFDSLISAMKVDSVDDLELSRRQVAHWKKIAGRQRKKLLDRDWLKEELASQIAVMESVTIAAAPQKSEYHEQVAVLELSDIHYGLSIAAEPLGVLFSGITPQITLNRLAYTFRAFARLSKSQSFPVNAIQVFLLGDLIEHSHMRPAQAKTTSMHVVKQVIDLAPHLIAGIQMLCSQFESVEIQCVPGNHGRATQRAQDSLPDETFEHLLYYMLQYALSRQPNLTINVHPSWYFIEDIYKYKFLGLHCEDAFSWMGVPFYGIRRLVKDYYMLAGQATKRKLRSLPLSETLTIGDVLDLIQTPDYVTIGHFHNPIDWAIMGVEVLANGSMSGISYYSAKRLHNVTPPVQKMFFVHPEHGVGLRLPINLDSVV